MSMTLGDIITAARDRHPAFHKSRVPDGTLARFLTGYQRRLISKAAEIHAESMGQQLSIIFAIAPENAVGVAGASTVGGLPGALAGTPPVLDEVELPAGSAAEMDFENAAVLVPEFVVAAATALTVQMAGAAWAVNAFQNKYVWVSDGPGIFQRRKIASNTANTLTLTQAWVTIPTIGVSLCEVVDPTVSISQQVGVVTTLPAESSRIGYLVRLDAAGVPYLDLTKPLVGQFGVGIDLPPMELPIGGSVRFANGDDTDFEFRRYSQRWTLGVSGYGGYMLGGKLFLIGNLEQWGGVVGIDVRYVPIAPAFTALKDLFLLPDTAYDALVLRAAQYCAGRVNGLPDYAAKVDPSPLAAEAGEAESIFLLGIGRPGRTFAKFVRDVT